MPHSLPLSRLLGLILAVPLLSMLAACSYTKAPIPCNLPAKVSYTTDVWPILKANCRDACHNPTDAVGGQYANFNMDDFSQVQHWATTKKGNTGITWMIGNITHESGFVAMPYNRDKLSDCDIAVIKAWVDAGAQQN